MRIKKELSQSDKDKLIEVLASRFQKHMHRHPEIEWSQIQSRLKTNHNAIWSLSQMESTGGEPDVVTCDAKSGKFAFFDCSPQTPQGRRNLCYDHDAWVSRKSFRPASNAMDMAKDMGVEILDESQYRQLQQLEEFDTKTSSWIKTPSSIRSLGGALFADRRYGSIFIYHNSAPSYYSSRGFRAVLTI